MMAAVSGTAAKAELRVADCERRPSLMVNAGLLTCRLMRGHAALMPTP